MYNLKKNRVFKKIDDIKLQNLLHFKSFNFIYLYICVCYYDSYKLNNTHTLKLGKLLFIKNILSQRRD